MIHCLGARAYLTFYLEVNKLKILMTNNIYKDLDLVGMKKVASEIATTLKIGDVVKLNGDLGAGKTTFAGFLINALLEKTEVVTSPTFNLLHEYKAPQGKIYHFDLYRLKSSDELENIGIYLSLIHI